MYRFTGRINLRLKVELWHRHVSLGTYLTRDIDPFAVFIEAACLGLHAQAAIRADFLIDPENTIKHTIEGKVIRTTPHGVVVQFASDTGLLFERLELLALSTAR